MLLFGDKGLTKCQEDLVSKCLPKPAGETPASFSEYEFQVLSSEVDAMKLILNKKHGKLPYAILALIDAKEKSLQEIHDYLSAIFAKVPDRKHLVKNWKLKRLIVDSNFIFRHLGLRGIGYVDGKIPVSKRAMAIVKNLGPKEEPYIDWEMKVGVKKIKNVKRKETVKQQWFDRDGELDFDCGSSSESDSESDSGDESISEKDSDDDRNFTKKVCLSYDPYKEIKMGKIEPDHEEIKKARVDMEEIVIPELKPTYMDQRIKNECLSQMLEEVTFSEIKSYRDVLITEVKEEISKNLVDLKSLKEVIKDPKILDKELEDELWTNKEFEPINNVFGHGVEKVIDLGGPRLFRQAVDQYYEMKNRITSDFEEYKKVNRLNYRNKRDIVFREKAAENFQSKLKATAKLNAFRILLDSVKVKEFERMSLDEKVVKTDYFKSEAIRRSMIDLEHKRRNFNKFKMNRTRKQRVRSIKDKFFESSTVCSGRKKAYGDHFDATEKPTVSFIRKSLSYIKKKYLRMTEDTFMMNDICEYFEPIPFRRFTINGVEIRNLENIGHLKILKEKRKATEVFGNKAKKPDKKFKGLMPPRTSVKLMQWYEGLIDKLEKRVLNFDNEEKQEVDSLNKEILELRQAIETPVMKDFKMFDDTDEYYGRLDKLIEKREGLFLTMEEFSKHIDDLLKERWIGNRLEQKEIILREKIRILELRDEYNDEYIKLKMLRPDEEIISKMDFIEKVFVIKGSEFHKENLENNKNFLLAKRLVISSHKKIGDESNARREERKIEAQSGPKGNARSTLKKKVKVLRSRLSKIDDKYDEIRINARKHYESLYKKRGTVFMTMYNLEMSNLKKRAEIREGNKSKQKIMKMCDYNVLRKQIMDVEQRDTEPAMNIEEMSRYHEENKEGINFIFMTKIVDPKAVVRFNIR